MFHRWIIPVIGYFLDIVLRCCVFVSQSSSAGQRSLPSEEKPDTLLLDWQNSHGKRLQPHRAVISRAVCARWMSSYDYIDWKARNLQLWSLEQLLDLGWATKEGSIGRDSAIFSFDFSSDVCTLTGHSRMDECGVATSLAVIIVRSVRLWWQLKNGFIGRCNMHFEL